MMMPPPEYFTMPRRRTFFLITGARRCVPITAAFALSGGWSFAARAGPALAKMMGTAHEVRQIDTLTDETGVVSIRVHDLASTWLYSGLGDLCGRSPTVITGR